MKIEIFCFVNISYTVFINCTCKANLNNFLVSFYPYGPTVYNYGAVPSLQTHKSYKEYSQKH